MICQKSTMSNSIVDEVTHNVDTLVACDTDLSALGTQVDTNDTHGRAVLEREMAADSSRLYLLDKWMDTIALARLEACSRRVGVGRHCCDVFQKFYCEASTGL